MGRRARQSEESEIDTSRSYSPDDLFILPPQYPLPELGYVVGEDSNHDLRRFGELAQQDRSAHNLDKALAGKHKNPNSFHFFVELKIDYEHAQQFGGRRFLVSVMSLDQFRTQFSPLISRLIEALHRTYPHVF